MRPPRNPSLPPPPVFNPTRKRASTVAQGFSVLGIGILGFVGGVVGVLFTANPCGMFADHCSTYGQTGAGAALFATVAMWSIAVGFFGFLMVIVGAVRPARRNGPRLP